MKILAHGNDELIDEWTYANFGVRNFNADMSLAILEDKRLVGSIYFHAYNGFDIELSYFGPQTLTLGLLRTICRIAVDHFGVSRITVRTPETHKQMKRKIHKLGWVFEGVRHNGYGDTDAIMYGLYGRNLARLAGRQMQ